MRVTAASTDVGMALGTDTESIQTLLVGRDITGVGALA
jgi:hypothetical protein